jgi:two-component system chemotaxis sensor kinase CheA
VFSEEAGDQLREWEECLLALDRRPDDAERLNGVFRAIHTLKGSAGFIGFDSLQKVAHALESSLADVRDGTRAFDVQYAEVLFMGLDICRSMIDSFTQGGEFTGDTAGFLQKLAERGAAPDRPVRAVALAAAAQPSAAQAVPVTAGPVRTSRLEVRIEGIPREAYLRSFLVKARLDRLGRIMDAQPSPDALRDGDKPFVYVVTVESESPAEDLAAQIAVDMVSVAPVENAQAAPVVPAAPAAPESTREQTGVHTEEVVRVSVQKLDTLLNLVGELVIQNSGFHATTYALEQAQGKSALLAELEEKTEALSAITRQLQDGIMKARMLPVASVFNRFRRVVRDLARASGKTVSLEVSGEETEIDKKVIDRIGEPLVHLVRNAVDHGLETSAERTAAGKSTEGTIRLAASQEGDHICIEVSDDGRGLDTDAIVAKAVERGLIRAEEAQGVDSGRILGFIFLPGFSTAKTVTDISGRGVGMDAAKRAIEEMGGAVRVRSAPGRGTTVTITLPLTMAIITAALVEASGSTFAVPLSAVREIVKGTDSVLRTVGTRRVILLRNEVLALLDLAAAFTGAGPKGALTGGHPVVIVDFEGRKIGLEVERIVGTREIVVKSLSRHFREVEGLIGASILGSGRIALIVDVESLVRLHFHGSAAAHGRGQVVISPQAGTPLVQSGRSETPSEAQIDPPSLLRAEETAAAGGDPAQALTDARSLLLEEVHNAGAIQASISMSQLTGRDIRVSFPESRVVALKDVADLIGGEEAAVAGLYVGIGGDISGGSLLVFPRENLLSLDDMLHGKPPGTGTDISAVDLSSLSEMGNIIAASFINAVADAARLAIAPAVPEISIDMCQAVIDSVLARFNRAGEKILLTEASIYGSGIQNAVCHQLLFLEPASLERLLGELAAGARGARVPA